VSELDRNAVRIKSESCPICPGIHNYLQQHFAKSEGFPTADDVRPTYERLKNRWLENYVGLCKRKEAYTRTQFLDPLLTGIGWTFIPEQDLPSKSATRKRPDYCLFLNDETRQRAAKESETADVFRESATVLEAKKVQRSLDEISDEETPGWFPSQQVQNYLHNAKDKTGQRYFNWAILTNGNEWRLYCEKAANDAYFAFHLGIPAFLAAPRRRGVSARAAAGRAAALPTANCWQRQHRCQLADFKFANNANNASPKCFLSG
jgi:hypothetical protein